MSEEQGQMGGDPAANGQEVQEVADNQFQTDGAGGVGQERQDQGDQGQQQAPTFGPEQAAQVAAQAAAQVLQQQPQQQQQPQMSDEEVAKMLKQWSPSDELATRFASALTGGEDGAPNVGQLKAVLADMWNGQFDQARTYAELYPQYLLQQQMQQIQPVMQQAQQMMQVQREERFFQKYPGLKQYRQFLPQIAQQVLNNGAQFQTEEQQFDALANAAQQALKAANINISLGNQQGTGRKSASPMFGSGHNAAGSSQQKPRSASIWH